MRPKALLLFLTLSAGCWAQVRLTALKDMMQAPPSFVLALGANNSPATINLPPVSASIENGTLSLVIDSSTIRSANVRGDESNRLTESDSGSPVGNVVEPRDVTLPIKISDVTGLSAALSQINTSIASMTTTEANLTTTTTNTSTAVTNLSTSVANLSATVTNLTATLNTLSANVQNLVPVPTFVDFEIPAGTINGSNSVFVLSAAPSPASSLVLSKNGMKLSPANDYSISGSTILFVAGAVPQTGDLLIASYRR